LWDLRSVRSAILAGRVFANGPVDTLLVVACNARCVADMYVVMDAEARFRAVFEATSPTVARYARHRGLATSDVEDLVAATYEVAWRRLDVVPAGDQALPWLLAVALNLVRNHRRKLVRDRALLARLPAPDDVPPPRLPGGVSWKDIRRALDALAPDDRELVLLIAWDGLSPGQAAVVLGVSAVAARSRLHRARERLADELGIDRVPPPPIPDHNDEAKSVRRSEA
jgi:RNA polymerase sigma factor (sigma-70 family)